jgi:hypothetical protein
VKKTTRHNFGSGAFDLGDCSQISHIWFFGNKSNISLVGKMCYQIGTGVYTTIPPSKHKSTMLFLLYLGQFDLMIALGIIRSLWNVIGCRFPRWPAGELLCVAPVS